MTHLEALPFAVNAANESPCRSKRGAVIWDNTRWNNQGYAYREVIAVGFNQLPGLYTCDGSERCKSNCGKTALHAEQAAILRAQPVQLVGASMLHIKTVDGLPVPGGPPSCLECSKLILASGISWMWLFVGVEEDTAEWCRYSAEEFHYKTLDYFFEQCRKAGARE